MRKPTIVSAYAILENDKGQILLTREMDRPGYKLPGGWIDFEETVIEGVLREVKEEVGLLAKIEELVWAEEYFNKGRDHRIRLFFRAKVEGEEPVINGDEVESVEWVARDDLERMGDERFFRSSYYKATRIYLEDKKVGELISLVK